MQMKKPTPSHQQTATKAVLYLRVSTTEQADHGVSLAAQETKLRSYCQLRELVVADVVIDAGVSAGKPLASREGGKRVLELVQRRQVQAVVAFKLDRLFRNCGDCLQTTEAWDRKGIALHLVDLGGQTLDTSSAMGRFFLTVMAGAAELERGLVVERTVSALGYKKSRGERVGTIAYGSQLGDDGVTLLPDKGEQAVIAAVKRARNRGLSGRAIVAELARQGFVTRKGTEIRLTQVQRILKAHHAA
jgi:DNA invertase Pin-like site-specific DNA recombinase